MDSPIDFFPQYFFSMLGGGGGGGYFWGEPISLFLSKMLIGGLPALIEDLFFFKVYPPLKKRKINYAQIFIQQQVSPYSSILHYVILKLQFHLNCSFLRILNEMQD